MYLMVVSEIHLISDYCRGVGADTTSTFVMTEYLCFFCFFILKVKIFRFSDFQGVVLVELMRRASERAGED